ncbi:unnamed protein product [Paramecium sonneborni]|uniref:Cyclic nucleotide-binding domain-containing protein n=1 Tax=Paramecium sonneborni TaxID=65129 RepID=A0A8S1PW17_9CILI|nr:unnamed protein product [Paramecium sonneborni]
MDQEINDTQEESSQELTGEEQQSDQQSKESEHKKQFQNKPKKTQFEQKILDRINTNFQCIKYKHLTKQQNMILDDLQLNTEVLEERSQVVLLQRCKVLKKYFSIEFQLKLLKVAETIHVRKNELIIVQNEIDDCSLFLIKEGIIELFLSYRNLEKQIIKRNTLSELRNNQCFGEQSFFSGKAPLAGARAIQDSVLIKITRENFLLILNQFPSDQEKYFEINHELLNNRISCLGLSCFLCGSKYHLALSCTKLIYMPDKEAVIKRYLLSKSHYRLQLPRNERKKFQTLLQLDENMKLALEIGKKGIAIEQCEQKEFFNCGYSFSNIKDQFDIDQIQTFVNYQPNRNVHVIIKKYNELLEMRRGNNIMDQN